MADIHYETIDSGGVYLIDEISQRFLVYLHLHGGSPPDEAMNPVGVSQKSEIHTRVNENLGSEAAGLVEEHEFVRNTLTGEQDVFHYRLTDDGESFVYNHKASLSLPADLTELAEKVAGLRVDLDDLRDIGDRVRDLEARLTELEEQQ
ncbi:hypothetical protein [Halobacterium rubrum]|uniref:hypothetical protein n=1 Tax=Halobacterium TaxID=2239 RepID=UPI001F18B18A|nr:MULTISPECIES: hypothetical protein [Halobacterium]MDH5020359.1 hypothetical protein [Halobacterium rubrum]